MPPVVVLPNVSTNVSQDGYLDIDFLLPTGIMVAMNINFYSALDVLKQNLWKEAQNLPLNNLLKDSDSYCFICINQLGEKEELLDESQCLNDIQPFSSFLKLVEKQGDEQNKTLARNINSLVGKGPQKMEAWSPAEVSEFRQKMVQHCDRIIQNKKQQGWVEKLKLKHPPILRSTWNLPERVQANLSNDCIAVDVKIEDTGTTYKLKTSAMGTPSDLIDVALKKMSSTGQKVGSSDCYLIKVVGREEYIYGDSPLQQFKFVYQCLTKNLCPEFWLLNRENVVDAPPPVPPRRMSTIPRQLRPDRSDISVWNIPQKYYVTVKGINKIQLPDNIKVKLFVGLYHGSEPLCIICETPEVPVLNSSCNMTIDLKFNIAVADLPNASRICFALYASGRKGKDMTPVAWVNIPAYDFRSRLIRGDREMDMWSVKDDLTFEEICYVLGTVSPNPYGHDSATLSVSFPDYGVQAAIIYPKYDKVLECAARNMEADGTPGSVGMKVSKSHIEQLKLILERDPLTQLFEQDKDLLWLLRYECCDKYPHSLPRLLNSVKWNNHIDTAKMTALLQNWKMLPVDYALELLDFNFPDRNVRKFAISCLNANLEDAEMSQYLLQLVQAVKYEIYLNCPLVEFLLTRAVKNQHIGQQLFWHLKSEMHDPTVMVRFRLILEVYLRIRKDHLLILLKQSEGLSKLKALNEVVKNSKYNLQEQKQKDRAKEDMKKILRQKTYIDCLSNLYSPLTPIYKLKDLLTDQCSFKNSKKRPLHLIWSNEDRCGANINLIFKDGDDLRQDMLTLQMLQIMDGIWQEEGLDLRMNPYGCLATGLEQGVIEVVTSSNTIANIQVWYGKGAFEKRALYEWLKMYNTTPESLNKAVEEFMLSCAGYCVATYVLGIGDRHNDNIMLKQSGQLFHIDFGHFLGNIKKKFGVKRERVPFVLTTHFVHVIKHGGPNSFDKFRDYCEQAYLILRKKSHLLFSLFMMMLSSGIPQLTCTKDVDYLKESLVPNLNEADARRHFQAKFNEALRNSWTSSVNFYIHMKAKDNT
ncbi:phosphatidylinositol 4,5-bisphosphate 3-kinase catalytic subunit beta isoform [Patella vulgata]|uniref:phosphatidylinositol 4,5-bisphosphate 3-kinase catalytic subunit beta isoform n=1 Tax=Patella vulgata TaxID=6465 RepID=UPI0024A7DA17|nr:phosphatidylinositol 4,5-bisphosphate 3-kinase catalytic subunit beta isoform [Patella vulgata]